MWRPKNWDTELDKLYGNWEYAFPSLRQAFEVGADAMLEALKNRGFKGELWKSFSEPAKDTVYLESIKEMLKKQEDEYKVEGTWAFIPEEK